MSTKFAKKGGLVIDVTEGKAPKMAVRGSNPSKVSEQKLLKRVEEAEAAEGKGAKVKKLPAGVAKGAKTTAKAEKPAKGAKVATKATKAAKAPKEATERAPRGRFADKKIKVVSKKIDAREGSLREALMQAIIGAKNTNDVLGTEVTANGRTGRVSSNDINFAIESGLITVA